MFIVKIHDSTHIHSFVCSGDSKSACDAVLALISSFEYRTLDWLEPVFASILSDNGEHYNSKRIGFSSIVKPGDAILFPINDAARKELDARKISCESNQ